MRFYVDIDYGNGIEGWLAPDNPSAIPKLRVINSRFGAIEFDGNMVRDDVRESGMHATGHCGFRIDDTIIPGLSPEDDIEIHEAATGMQIFRRSRPEDVPRRVAYIDASLMPQNKIFSQMKSTFTLYNTSVERLSLETLICLIHATYCSSSAIIGRMSLMRYLGYLESNEFFTTAVLNDPFEELAEKILFIQLLSTSNVAHLLPAFTAGVEALVPFALSLDLTSKKALSFGFRSMDESVSAMIASPMTRMLACNPEEMPERRHLTTALDNLSSLSLVGLRRRFPEFCGLLNGILGTNIVASTQTAPSPTVLELADRLAKIGVVQRLLELDQTLYSFAESAVDNGMESALDA